MKEILIFLLLLLFIENTSINTCFGGIKLLGECICPKGKINKFGKCVKETKFCLGGKVIENKCICPSRTKLKNGNCENNLQITKPNKIKKIN